MRALDMAMATAEAVEMQNIDECVAGVDGANDTIERLAFATETKYSFVDFPHRNASVSGDWRYFRKAIGPMMSASMVAVMGLVISEVNA